MIDCPDCRDYYKSDRPRIIAGRTDHSDLGWVTRWLARYHDAGHADPTTVDIDLVRTAAALVYFPAGVDVFMTGRNAALNHQRPLDLIEAGRTDEVLALLERLTAGAMG